MEKSRVLLLALDEPQSGTAALTYPERVCGDEAESLVYRRVKRQVLEHGLARQRGQVSVKESHQRARITRLERQIAIVERYHREKAQQELQLKAREETPNETKMPSGASGTIAPERISRFRRKISLRQLPPRLSNPQGMNQLEESLLARGGLSSPTTSDIETFAVRATQQVTPPQVVVSLDADQSLASKSTAVKEPGTRSHSDKSIAHVLCEFNITKGIMMREPLVKEVHETVEDLNRLASELYDMTQRKLLLEGSSGAGVPISMPRRPSNSGVVAGKQPKSGDILGIGPVDPTRRMDELAEWEAKNTNLMQSAQQRVKTLQRLVASLQAVTVDLVISILEWRGYKSKPSIISNIDKLHRFGWKKRSIANYLIHLDTDLRDLFPSAAMSVLLGVNAKYNPLLLPRAMLDAMEFAEDTFVSTTFLTAREDVRSGVFGVAPTREASSPTKRQAYVALNNAVKMCVSTSNAGISSAQQDQEKWHRCLLAIQREHELEYHAMEIQTAEKQRLAGAYNPFESIKIAGGVEDAIASAVTPQVFQDAIERAKQLRRRQEDTSRIKEQSCHTVNEGGHSTDRQQALVVNPARVRQIIVQRKEAREAAADCEARNTTASSVKNKLGGQVMVRRMNIRRMQNQNARKIQRQFLVHRRRTQLLSTLARFVVASRQHVVSIQRFVRGFLAKKRYYAEKHRLEEQHRRHMAAKRIWYAYKHYKRRQRHHQSMSVEAVAQIQLLQVIQHHLEENEASTAERYRKVGEERRRQRAIYMYKRRQEQLALDAKKAAAAVRIQSAYRMHLAKKTTVKLRAERRAHLAAVSAMMIQSKIRSFLRSQETRRQRFRSDMERVNRSAVRIQSIYRGYSSRTSFLEELNALGQSNAAFYGSRTTLGEEEYDDDEDEVEAHSHDGRDDDQVGALLPPIFKPRSATPELSLESLDKPQATKESPPKVSLPPIRPRMPSVQRHTSISSRRAQPPPPVQRQPATEMTKVELKLKETTLGIELESNATGSAHRNSNGDFLGQFRRRTSGSTSASPRVSPADSNTGIIGPLRGRPPSQ